VPGATENAAATCDGAGTSRTEMSSVEPARPRLAASVIHDPEGGHVVLRQPIEDVDGPAERQSITLSVHPADLHDAFSAYRALLANRSSA
jgi:hypothetical protein